ncbi:MAG: amino acid ABC transporter permease [Candidatus Dependentiae bacterium]|nr:amino acid ABC transporter permease [Candidatus Dependentiae bacterium]
MGDLVSQLIFVASGLFITVELLIGGCLIGCAGGVSLAFLRYNGIAVWPIDALISVLRGTPLILQLALLYFAIPGLLGIKLGIVAAGVLAFGLNSSAYTAEIVRAGIEQVPQGQFEAALTLEIPSFYLWKDIILPQVLRNVLPALVNEVIVLLKETALIATIGGMDIMRRAQVLAAQQASYFQPLCIAGACYYILVLLITYLGKKSEKWGDHGKHT